LMMIQDTKKCAKGYPKQFQNETLQGEDFYPVYCYWQDGHYIEVKVGNRMVLLDN